LVVADRQWKEDPRFAGGPEGPLQQAVGRELVELGWREDMADRLGTLGTQAILLAENIDSVGGAASYWVAGANKELRETMKEVRDAVGSADAGKVDADGKRKETEVSDFAARRARRSAPPAGSGR
jgi:hypothetical protein